MPLYCSEIHYKVSRDAHTEHWDFNTVCLKGMKSSDMGQAYFSDGEGQ